MAMVNMNNLLNGKDSRWLQLEVCREFQRNKCSRPDTECKFAHPPANVEVQNGRVTACYDSIKGRCNRETPPCKYFHPPQHLKDQLLINGRNHLALKNALMQQMGLTPGQPLVPGQVPTVATNPYLSMPQVGSTYSPYFAPGPIMPAIMGPDPSGVGSPLSVVPQTVVAQQKMPRSDRLEVCREYQRGACKRAEPECRFAHPADTVTANEDGTVTVCMDAVKGRCNRDPCRYFHPPLHLQAHIKAAQSRASASAAAVSPLQQAQAVAAAAAASTPLGQLAPNPAPLELGKKRARDPSTAAADTDLLLMDMKSVGSFYYENFAFPGMVPYKRPATDKSGVPVYQPSATTYQQLMQLQQPFVPVSCEYSTPPPAIPVTGSPATSVASEPSPRSLPALPAAAAADVQTDSAAAARGGLLPNASTPQPPPPLPPPIMPDAAAIAKEVAQQNYAKKVAAVNSSMNQQLNALTYTGVALNKQAAAAAAVSMPPPPPPSIPRFPMHVASVQHLASLGFASPFQNASAQGLLPYAAAAAAAAAASSRPPPPTAVFNPYSLLRQHLPFAANPYATNPALHQQLVNHQTLLTTAHHHHMPPYSLASSITPVSVAATASLAQSNNNNVVIQPYKKMKTT